MDKVMARSPKWTQELRKIVYARITMEFGPHHQRNGKTVPEGKGERYREVLVELTKYLSILTGETFGPRAIEQQVNWAVTTQEAVTSSGHARQYFMNKAAALEMGFIQSSELPEYMLSDATDSDNV
jgi:hypothetical protein